MKNSDYMIKFDILKTYTLLGHFLESTVKSMIYKGAFIEWE
jgi:hypothetical protein